MNRSTWITYILVVAVSAAGAHILKSLLPADLPTDIAGRIDVGITFAIASGILIALSRWSPEHGREHSDAAAFAAVFAAFFLLMAFVRAVMA